MQAASEPRGDMPFLEHLRELRRRVICSLWGLLAGTVIGYLTYHYYVPFLTEPFGQELKMRVITEGFVMQMQISLYAGIILSFPLHMYNITAFVVPALEERERRVLFAFLGGSVLLGLAGLYLAYFQILPISIEFLGNFKPASTEYDLFFKENLTKLFQLVLAFIILFQVPLVQIVLMWFGVVSRATFLRIGRYFAVVIFTVAAVITPPDIISQIGLAVPLIILYYLAILIAKIFNLGAADA